jgi:hypothetical protein
MTFMDHVFQRNLETECSHFGIQDQFARTHPKIARPYSEDA